MFEMFGKKKVNNLILILTSALLLNVGGTGLRAFADSTTNSNSSNTVINEKFGKPILVYGGSLTPTQRQEVRDDLKITDPTTVLEMDVTGKDLVKYITDGDPRSNMYSSVLITRLDSGNGIQIQQVTPQNITQVTDSMYANAMLTAGIQDAKVEVVSPVKVTGHSALTGIYKAYESQGVNLNKDRMNVANQELNVATDLVQSKAVTNDQANSLLVGIKKDMAQNMPKDRAGVQQIVNDQLKAQNITLSDSDVKMLVDLFDKMRTININFNDVKSQLNNMSKQLDDKLKQVTGTSTEGFWQSVRTFFENLFHSIGDFFK
jgi:uncharacterized protein YpuA (DUF1002 family)